MVLAVIKHPNVANFLRCSKKYAAATKLIKLPQRMLATNATSSAKTASKCSHLQPKCGDYFKDGPCDDLKNPKEVKLPQPAPPAKEKPQIKIKRSVLCCGDPCPDAFPRFDKLYYRRSDKDQRSYQQTWDECPEQFFKPKAICSQQPVKPKLKKRPRKERPQTACKQEVCLQSKSKCPYIGMPNCKSGRKPPSCLTQKKPSECTKRSTPYPSFSECTRGKAKISLTACNCLSIPSICAVWAYHHRQLQIKKSSQC